jgi:hypothetical protein
MQGSRRLALKSLVDPILADYGPEAKEVREHYETVESVLRKSGLRKSDSGGLRANESVDAAKISGKPRTHAKERSAEIGSRKYKINTDVLQTRLLLMEGQQTPFRHHSLLLIFWLTVFRWLWTVCFRNGTVLSVLLICALSISSAIFLVLEMNRPLDGFIKASNAPLRKAVELIGK